MSPVRKTTRARAAADPTAPKPLDTVVAAAFTEDDKIRDVLAKRLAPRALEARALAERATAAFTNFRPSVFSSAERARRNFLSEGEDLSRVMRSTVQRGVERMRDSADGRSLRIHLGDDATRLVAAPAGPNRRIALDDLLKYIGGKLGEAKTLQNDPTRTMCEAEARADDVLAAIEETRVPAPAAPAAPAGPAPAAPAATTDDDGAARTAAFVDDNVRRLMADVVPPETRVRYAVDSRATRGEAQEHVDTFELRAGASDVTSYHDFKVLHIAFEHVWTELFDDRLQTLGTQLYYEAVKLEEFLQPGATTNLNFDITSIPDLLGLIKDIQALNDQAAEALPNTGAAARSISTFVPPPPVSVTLGGVPPGTASSGDGDYLTVATRTENGVPTETRKVAVIPGAARLSKLLDEIRLLLKERYAFAVFAKDSYNFGMLVTYRQTWRPEKYQVGDLVSTIPLAPRETRRYTTRRVVKKTRAQREIEESVRTTRTETSGTSRVEREIVDKALAKTNYDLTSQNTFGGEGYKADITGRTGGEQATQSEKAKKHFHEAVLKSAQEYRQQHRLEIDTTASEETEETTFHEIQNPNDELTVTYMFYELQRTYRIGERIHQLTPVILVANEVPAPDAINDSWLIANDWIIRRVLLDDSFKPALDYLTKSFVGAELNLRILDTNAKAQKQVVDRINQQIALQAQRIEQDERRLANQVQSYASTQSAAGALNTVKRIFDPLGLTGKEGEGEIGSQETMVDFLQETYDRAEREKARLLEQLGVATTALQGAIDKLSAATKEHFDRIAEIDRLRIHVKANILHYMQAIWSHEPPDQRFFRVYDIDVDIVEPATAGVTVPLMAVPPGPRDVLRGRAPVGASLAIPPVSITKKKLVEIADLDTVLGYKGNYAIYALNENNFITLHMMQDYLELSEEVTLRDPDEFGGWSVEELQRLASCMYKRDPTGFANYRQQFRDLIIKRLTSGRPEDDRVIVPTDSLYIEALVGTHPLLEDFKLIHRALDVKKVQAETRHAELENVRLAARALRGEDEDPDIERKVVIEGGSPVIGVDPDGD